MGYISSREIGLRNPVILISAVPSAAVLRSHLNFFVCILYYNFRCWNRLIISHRWLLGENIYFP